MSNAIEFIRNIFNLKKDRLQEVIEESNVIIKDSNNKINTDEQLKEFIVDNFKKLPDSFTFTPKTSNEFNFKQKKINWVNITNSDDKINLEEYWKFRKIVVDSMINYVIKKKSCNYCSFKGVGSVTWESDYDPSVSGIYREIVVNEFNELFRSIFKAESGEIFDTNVYGVSYLTVVSKEEKINEVYDTIKEDNKGKIFKYISLPSGIEQNIRNSRSWAFIKLFRYMDNQETIDRFIKDNIVGCDAHLLHRDINFALTRYKQLPNKDNYNNLEEFNKKYGEKLKDVKLKREELEDPNNGRSEICKKIEYNDSIAYANFYGSETYFTQGAFFHTVGIIQMKLSELPITSNQLLDSFIENVGDLFKELKHLKEKNTKISEDDCYKGVIKLSKYWMRMLDAIKRIKLQEKKFEFVLKDFDINIQNATDQATNIRSTYRGKDINLQKIKSKLDTFLKLFKINECNLDQIKINITKFLIDVLKVHYSNSIETQDKPHEYCSVINNNPGDMIDVKKIAFKDDLCLREIEPLVIKPQVGGQDTYFKKYLKYKNKYLLLKHK